MVEFFKEIDEKVLKKKIDLFEETYDVIDEQYSTCYYNSNMTGKIWHCVMVTYRNKIK